MPVHAPLGVVARVRVVLDQPVPERRASRVQHAVDVAVRRGEQRGVDGWELEVRAMALAAVLDGCLERGLGVGVGQGREAEALVVGVRGGVCGVGEGGRGLRGAEEVVDVEALKAVDRGVGNQVGHDVGFAWGGRRGGLEGVDGVEAVERVGLVGRNESAAAFLGWYAINYKPSGWEGGIVRGQRVDNVFLPEDLGAAQGEEGVPDTQDDIVLSEEQGV
jgi:hypothetical protein